MGQDFLDILYAPFKNGMSLTLSVHLRNNRPNLDTDGIVGRGHGGGRGGGLCLSGGHHRHVLQGSYRYTNTHLSRIGLLSLDIQQMEGHSVIWYLNITNLSTFDDL